MLQVSEQNRDNETKLKKRDAQLYRMRESNRSLTNLTQVNNVLYAKSTFKVMASAFQSKKLDEREKLQMDLDEANSQIALRDDENRVRPDS